MNQLQSRRVCCSGNPSSAQYCGPSCHVNSLLRDTGRGMRALMDVEEADYSEASQREMTLDAL